MEGRRGQHGIHRLRDRERALEVGLRVRHPVAEPPQPASGLLEHRGGGIQRDDPAPRQPRQQQLGHPARAAAGIEHGLVAFERQASEHFRAPACLGIRDLVV